MSQNYACICCRALASCSLSSPDPAVLSCLHPQRWKRFTQNELLCQEGAVGESVGEREIQLGRGCTAVGHQNMHLKSPHKTEVCKKLLMMIPRIFSSLEPSYLPSLTPLAPPPANTHHPPALCAPPQKSSDSWKVLGVYSVTTKQNHLKTKWVGECAGAIRPLCLCGHREKRPLRIKGMDGRSGKWRAGGGGPSIISICRLSTRTPTQTQF